MKQLLSPTLRSAHGVYIVKQYLENKVTAGVLQVLELQAQSPDMSPIEAMWDYLLKTEENKRNQNNLTEKCGMYYRISGP